jgi:hypothetical protein
MGDDSGSLERDGLVPGAVDASGLEAEAGEFAYDVGQRLRFAGRAGLATLILVACKHLDVTPHLLGRDCTGARRRFNRCKGGEKESERRGGAEQA